MTQYINYKAMNSSEQHVFNSTGECPSVYLMSEGEYEAQLDKATQQAQDSDKNTVETVQ